MTKAPIENEDSFFDDVLRMRHEAAYPYFVTRFRVGHVCSTQGIRIEKDCGITAVIWGCSLEEFAKALKLSPDHARQLVAETRLVRKRRKRAQKK